MAVPDWPGTYGGNMFLYPISLMSRPRVFLEHSHRLFGALIGLSMVVLLGWALISDRRTWAKVFAGVLLLAVIAQGVIGGLRVTENRPALAALHGVAAQIFFAGVVAFATLLGSTVAAIRTTAERGTFVATARDRRMKALASAALHSTIVQLLFGAMYRHMQHTHVLWTHAAFAVVVLVLAVGAGALAQGRGEQPGQDAASPWNRMLSRTGVGILVCVLVQFALGWAAFLVVSLHPQQEIKVAEAAIEAAPPTWYETLIPTLHQANGALLLALLTINWVVARRVWKAGRE
jgi:cytochrome c oxidase assembly protein subunit 15